MPQLTTSNSLTGGSAVRVVGVSNFPNDRNLILSAGSNLLTYVFTTEDGLCSVQVFLIAPATVAHASTYQIWRGAEAVLHRCVTDPRFIGGVASNIGTWPSPSSTLLPGAFKRKNSKAKPVVGGDNKLAVVVQSSNNVNVQCTRGPAPPPPYEQCHLVAYNLPATLNRETFGSIGDPTVENPLPQEFTSRKSSGLFKSRFSSKLINPVSPQKCPAGSVQSESRFLRQRRKLRRGTTYGRPSTPRRRCVSGTIWLEKSLESVSEPSYRAVLEIHAPRRSR